MMADEINLGEHIDGDEILARNRRPTLGEQTQEELQSPEEK